MLYIKTGTGAGIS